MSISVCARLTGGLCGLLLLLAPLYAAKTARSRQLEQQVYALNNAFRYAEAVQRLHAYLEDKTLSVEERYDACVYLSFTYKRLFDYPATLKYLDQALVYGLQSPDREYYVANIRCQKALALFDLRHYQASDSLMQLLTATGFRHIDEENQSKIIMQQAYLLYLARKYPVAEAMYDQAIGLMRRSSPCDLPMIYAKKIELYGATRQEALLQDAYRRSLASADSCGILKYTIYTKTMMRNALGAWYNLAPLMADLDSLNALYNDTEHLKQITELDKRHQVALKDAEIASRRRQMMALSCVILLLVLSLAGLGYLFVIQHRQRTIIARQNALNEQVIHILSHDIKEPLLGVTMLLRKLDIRDGYLAQASESLKDQINAVNSLVNNLLTIRKVSLQPRRREPAEVNPVVEQVLHGLRNAIAAKNLVIRQETDGNPQMNIEKEKLRVILQNLLSNAVKFSFPGGIIELTADESGFSVRDFGPGIPPDQTRRLMHEVVPAAEGTRHEKGSGLGLYLIGQMLHGSNIRLVFESPAGGGTRVRIVAGKTA